MKKTLINDLSLIEEKEKNLYFTDSLEFEEIQKKQGDGNGFEYREDENDLIEGYIEAEDLCKLNFKDLESLDDDSLVEYENLILIKKPKVKYTDSEKAIVAEENMALIPYMIKRFFNTGIPYDELHSVGMIGYAKAIDSFDKSKDTKFSTYALTCIKNEIMFFLRREQKHMNNTVSLNKILSMDKNGNNLQLEDIVSSEELKNEKSLEDLILDEEMKQVLIKAVSHLKEDERFILTYRFGLDRGIIKTQKEIAEAINMSQANVSKIQKNCLSKLKLLLRKEVIY